MKKVELQLKKKHLSFKEKKMRRENTLKMKIKSTGNVKRSLKMTLEISSKPCTLSKKKSLV